MSAWAKPGVKCVCIAPKRLNGFHLLPVAEAVVGCIYTIRAIVEANGGSDPCKLGLLFEEIVNPISPTFGTEYGYFIDRFRPLVPPAAKSQSEDVALFTDALTKVGEPA